MAQRKYILFVVGFITIFFVNIQGQKLVAQQNTRLVNENKKWGPENAKTAFEDKYSKKSNQWKLDRTNLPLKKQSLVVRGESNKSTYPSLTTGIPILQSNSYYEQLGFFCRKEIQLQRITTIPVKFRLGSYDYVNWLEGKNINPR